MKVLVVFLMLIALVSCTQQVGIDNERPLKQFEFSLRDCWPSKTFSVVAFTVAGDVGWWRGHGGYLVGLSDERIAFVTSVSYVAGIRDRGASGDMIFGYWPDDISYAEYPFYEPDSVLLQIPLIDSEYEIPIKKFLLGVHPNTITSTQDWWDNHGSGGGRHCCSILPGIHGTFP
jgi:hypothetical protein